MATYFRGQQARIGNYSETSGTAAFKNLAGTDTDPTTVTLTIERPDATSLVYGYPSAGADGTLTKEAATTGRYYADVELDQSGTWRCQLEGTGAADTVYQWSLHVRRSLVA